MEAPQDQIFITEDALHRLSPLVGGNGSADSGHVNALRKRLEKAVVVAPENMPLDVVTIGSRFRLKDLDTGDAREYTLVLPKRARLEQGYVSVLAPIGASLLGAREGQTIAFKTPLSTRRLQIAYVYAPASAPLLARV